jgi:peptidoglycan-associated lipoprotein
MKCTKSATLFAAALAATVAFSGCKKKPQGTTPLPGATAGQVRDQNPQPPSRPPETGPGTSGVPIDTTPRTVNTGPGPGTTGAPLGPTVPVNPDGVPPSAPGNFENTTEDRGRFADDTVYFDFDKYLVRPGEAHKLDAVAAAMKGMPDKLLRIEGHCDERGTEEYNRALGERRALAVREYLTRAGMDASRIDTITFGKDRPVEMGHSEAAWSKNRRGEVILLIPK